jgi:glycosyltransferase involved in cell wall biosynthesis
MALASVSVIIPCYCCVDTISKTVESVATQSLRPKELILIDDGSTDNTSELLLYLQNCYGPDWIKVILLKDNHGVSYARNLGWDVASQIYIAFLDGDDIWHVDKIACQYGWMLNHPDIDGSGHNCLTVNRTRELPPLVYHPFPAAYPVIFNSLLYSNPLTPSSMMLKRQISSRFSIKLNYCEDHLLWLELVSAGFSLVILDTTLAYKQIGGKNASKKLWKMRLGNLKSYEQLRKTKKINFFKFIFLVVFSCLKFISLLIIGPTAQQALNIFYKKNKKRLNWINDSKYTVN